jgi:hypothetical protein
MINNLVAPPGPGVVNPPAPLATFRERYNDATQDTYNGLYNGYCNYFMPDAARAPAALRDEVTNQNDEADCKDNCWRREGRSRSTLGSSIFDRNKRG